MLACWAVRRPPCSLSGELQRGAGLGMYDATQVAEGYRERRRASRRLREHIAFMQRDPAMDAEVATVCALVESGALLD